MSTLHMLHLNAVNSFPLFVILSFTLGEVDGALKQLLAASVYFLFLFIILLLSGMVLMLSTFLCTMLCSALTTSVVGVPKSFLQTFIGYYSFGGVPYHPLNVAGR